MTDDRTKEAWREAFEAWCSAGPSEWPARKYQERGFCAGFLAALSQSLEEVGRFLTEAEITEWWGPRCDDFEPGCRVCRAWGRHDIIAAMLEDDQQTKVEMAREARRALAPATDGDKG